jgi:transcriptional regulator with XRE-family HTH domain
MGTATLRLRDLRDARGLSLRALGRASGVHYVTLVRIEGGTMSPTLATLAKLAQALGVPVRDLIAPEAAPLSSRHPRPHAARPRARR